MGDSNPSGILDLAGAFGRNGLGDIGTAFGLLRRSLMGEEISAEDIPPGMQSQILQMAVGQLTPENIDAFLTRPETLDQIVAGLRTDTLSRVKEDGTPHPPENTIIAQYIAGLDGEELKGILTSTPAIANQLEDIIEETISERISEATSETTLGSALGFASVNGVYGPVTDGAESEEPEADSERSIGEAEASFSHNIPNEILSKNISDLTAEDFSDLGNQELAELLTRLPQEVFQEEILNRMNASIEGEDITISADTPEARLEAFNTALQTLEEENSGLGASFMIAVGLADDPETQVFAYIRAGIPAALDRLQRDLPGLAEEQANEQLQTMYGDAVTIENGQIHVDFEKFEPAQIKALFDENTEAVNLALTNEENWDMIEAMVRSDNAALIRGNRDRILEQMIPTMTEQGLDTFNNMLEDLPPEFKQMIMGFMDWIGDILGGWGIDIGGIIGPADEPARDPAASGQDTAADAAAATETRDPVTPVVPGQ